MAATTSEADYILAAQQFGLILDKAQKEAKHSFEDTYYASADVALLSDAFVDNAAELLLKRLKEPIREVKETFNPSLLFKNQPVLLIPSGALTGFVDSTMLKAFLDEYIKQGGTLIVFSQKHGYDFSSIPTLDGKPITGYGWEEDQNCFADSVTIENWHQMLSGQSRSTPTLNVDGYFTGYPANSTIMLRRTANGQPALLMYEHGLGRVILTSMYSDWAYGHGQTSQEEIALVRDMLSWAKKPVELPEIKPADSISVPVSLTNSTATDSASIKLQIWNPDRTTLLYEQPISLNIPTGQPATTNVTWQAPSDAVLGIYHIDYILMDSVGNVIQPQAETDTGRFVVSNPPQTGTLKKDVWLSITSPNQEVFFNEPFVYTFHVFNNTAITRNLTIKTLLPHTGRTHEWSVAANPIGDTTISGSDLFIDSRWMFETLRAYLYDENGVQIGSSMLSFKGVYPKVTVSTSTGKSMYARGETVSLSVNLKNTWNAATSVKLGVMITDPSNIVIYTNTQEVSLSANGTSVQPLLFALPANEQGGVHSISTEVYDSGNTKVGGDATSFELPLSQISISAGLPAAITIGANMFSFGLYNNGKSVVNSGTLDVSLKDPDGAVAATISQPFVLAMAQSTTINVPANIPALKFGAYTLSYSQNDETKIGRPATITLANIVATTVFFDKTFYRIRESANLAVNLENIGIFNLDNVSVTLSAPDAGYTDTKTMNIGRGQALTLQYAMPLPVTMAAGQHTVTVTLRLPGGASVAKDVTFAVPPSSLTLSLNQTAYTAGSSISPVIANSGGVDTQAHYRISLYDAKSALIVDRSLTETIPASSSLTLNLPVPVGATDGGYDLVVTYSDLKTGKSEIVPNSLSITGIKAALTVQTAKPTYLSTEGIIALSNIVSSGTAFQGGNLHLQVSTAMGAQRQKTWTSQFDLQQGVRDGVDTYGVNDWLIPDDDFNSASLDLSKWSTWGNISTQGGKAFVDSTTAASGLNSKWYFDGDFDIQVDFESNNSCGTEGAEFVVTDGIYWFYTKNTFSNGREAGVTINGGWGGWTAIGGYQSSGKMRIVKNSTTIIAFYWNGSGWSELLRSSYSQYGGKPYVAMHVWRGSGCPATSKFDNMRINSGRILKQNETVDSARLVRFNDNFDDGVINTDRWSVRSSESVTINETNGGLVTRDTQAGVQSYSNVAGRFPLNGDFDISVDWKTPIAPTSGDCGSILQISEMDRNIVTDNNLIGYALQIKIAYINGLGHIYQTGHYNGNSWDSWSSPVTTTDMYGKFRINRTGSIVTAWYWNNNLNQWEWNGNTAGYAWTSSWTSPSYVQLGMSNNFNDLPAVETDWNNFKVASGAAYLGKGTIRLRQDAGQTSNWQTIYWSSTEPDGTSMHFRTRTAESAGDLASALWNDYISSGSPITSPKGRWIELEATLATTNGVVTPLLNDVTVTYGSSLGDILWQADVLPNMAQGAVSDFTNNIGMLGNAGKYYLQGTATSSTGQTVATCEYPFFVAQGNTALSFSPDKRVYKPGEPVTITGEVKNLSTVIATNFSFILKSKVSVGMEQILTTENFTIPAGGSRLFSLTTTTGAEGIVTLTGTVTQNGSTLAQTSDQYVVAAPQVTATIAAPDVAGNDKFSIRLGLTNTGKIDAIVVVGKSFISQPETVMIPTGQTRFLQYQQQITEDTTYIFMLSGDLSQAVTKAVKYGLAGSVSVAPQAIYPEGKITIPAVLDNAGLLDGQFSVTYKLSQAATTVNQQAKSYYLPKGGSSGDTLSFDLTEGSYQLTAAGQLPVLAASAVFFVRKEVKTDLSLTVGTQTVGPLPVTINVTNLGYSPINGSIRLSLVDGTGTVAWINLQDVSLPFVQVPAATAFTFTINPAAVKPGYYTIKAELLDAGNRQLVAKTAPFILHGPVFDITQLPPYQAIPAGGNATMIFKVRNSGNQEGSFELSFKSDDLIDSTQTAWLKPGEEKEITFTLQGATDLEEKDNTATYRLKSGGSTVRAGVVVYHLSGIKLAVSATLDRQNYNVGDTANLSLTITQQDAGTGPNLFTRVNYNGYEEKRDYTLNGSQTLTFAVPLSQIAGEKLFYGIYYQSGRSIHLNTIYIRKADAELAVSTDKQVYSPREAVTVAISGSASGDLTLSGPGDFSTTFAFTGSGTKSFVLPATMTAGTYTVAYKLTDAVGKSISGSAPFDVAGIQVKVKEALFDKARYVANDAMQLALTIESNQDMPVTVRTWVVDPASGYTDSGSGEVTLTAAAPVIVTRNAALATTSSGIHKLIYGIYQGDLLLASGAKAFDIGEAVLIGLSTDKTDYPEITAPVTVKADIYGTTDGGLEYFLDGTSIKTDTLTLVGFIGYTFVVPPAKLTPGRHTLKAVLTSGGLTSTKETSFSCGSSLPDLMVRLSSEAVKGGTLNLTATVINQGKSTSAATMLALYNGEPAQGVTPFTTLNVPALAPNASTTLIHAWNVLGKAGDYIVYAVVDPANLVTEYNEANNTTSTSGSLPKLALGVSTTGTSFRANSVVEISVNYDNLSTSSLYQDLVLHVELTNPQGVTSLLKEAIITSLASATESTDVTVWNTTTSQPGSYVVTARLLGGGLTLLASNSTFLIEPTVAVTGALTLNKTEISQGTSPTIVFILSNSGNIITSGIARALVIDPQSGATKATVEQPVNLSVNGSQSGELTITSQGLELKSYLVNLQYVSQENQYTIAGASFGVKDGMPPVVTVLSPKAGSSYNSKIAIAVLATDDASGVERVECQADDGVWNILPLEDQVKGSYATAWLPTAADNGVHTVKFRGIDRATNQSNPISVTFTFDTVPPVLTLSILSDGAYTNNETPNIAGNVHDDLGFSELQINEAAVPVNADESFSYPLILRTGANTVTTIATDLSKNRTIDTRTINLDQSAPNLLITAPADNSKTATTLTTVSGTVDKTSAVTVKLGSDLQAAAMNGTDFSAVVTLVPGTNTIDIIATDLAGYSSVQKRTVVYDDQKPSLAVTEPVQDMRTNQDNLTIHGTVSDPYTAITVSIVMDGQSYTPAVVNGQFQQAVRFTSEKSYAILVTATNEAGAFTIGQRNVIFDVTPPALTINHVTSPTTLPNQIISGTREVGTTVNITCAGAVMGSIEYPTTATWRVQLNNLVSGDNMIVVTTSDSAANLTTASAKIIYSPIVPDYTFKFALFGNKGVSLSGGCYTDSYIGNPANRYYGQYKNGDVGTNLLQPCGIQLTGGAAIFGKALVGAGGNPATGVCINGGSSIYNNATGTLSDAMNMIPRTDPDGGTAMGGLILASNAKKTLSAGKYRFNQMNLSGNSKLMLNGNVTLHIDGNLKISGSAGIIIESGSLIIYVNGNKIDVNGGAIVNTSQDPRNLILYGTAEVQSINLSGGTSMYGLVFSPSAAIRVSGGQNTFGALIGNTIDLSGGASVHYDESLMNGINRP